MDIDNPLDQLHLAFIIFCKDIIYEMAFFALFILSKLQAFLLHNKTLFRLAIDGYIKGRKLIKHKRFITETSLYD